MWKKGNVQFNWPKLFQAFSVILSLIFFHNCIHSIISTCKNYAYWCNILTFRALLKEGKAYHYPCYSCGSRNQPIIAHKSCKNYAYWCNILTFRALLKEGKAYHYPCYSCGSRNQPIIAHKSGLRSSSAYHHFIAFKVL